MIFEKVDDISNLEINDIIVFKYGNKYISHRLISVEHKNGEIYLQTKGDNNKAADEFRIRETDVVGVVRMKVKHIGYPSIWFQELVS